MKVGDLLAMTAMTLLDDSRNWGHFWKIKSIHGTYQYPTYAILNLCLSHGGVITAIFIIPCPCIDGSDEHAHGAPYPFS
jgi:hypothetical protein